MSIDIKKAFTFIFKDRNWIEKMAIGGLFYFTAAIPQYVVNIISEYIKKNPHNLGISTYLGLGILAIILSFISFIISTIPTGYLLQSMHNEIHGDEPLLPEWKSKFRTYFSYGLKYFAVGFIYSFSFALIILPFVILSVIAKSTINWASLLIIIPGLLVLFALIVIFSLVYPFIKTAFADNFKISDCFKPVRLLKLISKAGIDYWVCIALAIIISVLAIAVIVIFTLVTCCIGAIFVPFFSLPLGLIIMNLFAQAYKNAKMQESQV